MMFKVHLFLLFCGGRKITNQSMRDLWVFFSLAMGYFISYFCLGLVLMGTKAGDCLLEG